MTTTWGMHVHFGQHPTRREKKKKKQKTVLGQQKLFLTFKVFRSIETGELQLLSLERKDDKIPKENSWF